MSDDETLTSRDLSFSPTTSPPESLGLTVLWSFDEPARSGEFLPFSEGERVVGRGPARPDDPGTRQLPLRIRPGDTHGTGPFLTRRISRAQLVARVVGGALELRNVGRTPLLHRGAAVEVARLAPGDIVELHNAMLLVCTRRSTELAPLKLAYPHHRFGDADSFGIVGESAEAWNLRAAIAFAAGRESHVLVHGPSGVGKELVARALHGISTRRRGPLVTRNAATFPESLIDAELYGNRPHYPNPGMPERAGLVGDAHKGVLLLDELGELSDGLQAHLLRVLDAGEYQRLGESKSRHSDFLLYGLTNRDPSKLKPDLLARLRHRIEVSPLQARREDIPLIARTLLRRAREQDPGLLESYFDGDEPRLTPGWVRSLVTRSYRTHTRELESLLWRSLESAQGPFLDLPPELEASDEVPEVAAAVQSASLTRDQVVAALEEANWVVAQAWQGLGLRNRDQLRRLMRKHGIARD